MRIQSLLNLKSDFAQIAADAGTSAEYLLQIAYGHSRASYGMAFRIEEATQKGVSRHDLRPDIFGPHPESDAA